MRSLGDPIRRFFGGNPAADVSTRLEPSSLEPLPGVSIDIPETDPLFAYLESSSGPVDVQRLVLASPALESLREAGVAVVVPLVTQGELIGTLNLGRRLSDQGYSSDDWRLLGSLAARAAPAIRVAQLVRKQAAEAAERERFERELQLAQLIQQQFLPRDLPKLDGWRVAAHYQPALVVGGDFYDFIDLDDGRIGIVVGDVTDKGVPAALVMARTHSILRAEAPRQVSPAAVLSRANALLVGEMPPHMSVTCLYGILEPATGRLVFANAGHNLPLVRTMSGVVELMATGLPLGLLPEATYESAEAILEPGAVLLLHSDGLVEAHGPNRDMFGFPRLRASMASDRSGSKLLDGLLDELREFAGPAWEQEDDITLVTLERANGARIAVDRDAAEGLLAVVLPATPGIEREAMTRVAEAVARFDLLPDRLEQLKTAVGETVMNAVEYGSRGRPEVPVHIEVEATPAAIRVRVSDAALSGPIRDVEEPDLEAKLDGRQRPRGWGLFLIRQMVDELDVALVDGRQLVTLTFDHEPAPPAEQTT
jgi:serine phosphatase RsbU (regulator of sigma subunit)/anti-sigma regulatory factor (Ser/Thr protein kinase)